MQRKGPNRTWEGSPPLSPRLSPCLPRVIKAERGKPVSGEDGPRQSDDRLGLRHRRKGKGEGGRAPPLPKLSGKGGKRPPVPARKLARRVSVMESTGRGKEQTLLQRGRPALKGSSSSSLGKAEANLGRRYSRQAGRQAERGVGR